MKRRLIFFAIVFVLLLVIFSLVRTIYRTYLVSGRTRVLEGEVLVLKNQREDLQKELKTKDTLRFVEQEARNKLGMVKKGETIVVIGKNREPGAQEAEKNGKNLAGLSNPQKWQTLFFREE